MHDNRVLLVMRNKLYSVDKTYNVIIYYSIETRLEAVALIHKSFKFPAGLVLAAAFETIRY